MADYTCHNLTESLVALRGWIKVYWVNINSNWLVIFTTKRLGNRCNVSVPVSVTPDNLFIFSGGTFLCSLIKPKGKPQFIFKQDADEMSTTQDPVFSPKCLLLKDHIYSSLKGPHIFKCFYLVRAL